MTDDELIARAELREVSQNMLNSVAARMAVFSRHNVRERSKCVTKFRAAARPEVVLVLLDEIERLRAALVIIAAYDDANADYHLKTTGSYSRFDEPGSVQLARAALNPEKQP